MFCAMASWLRATVTAGPDSSEAKHGTAWQSGERHGAVGTMLGFLLLWPHRAATTLLMTAWQACP